MIEGFTDFVSIALSACADGFIQAIAQDESVLPLGAMATASATAASPFIFQVSIFVLACFVGYYVVWSVTPALHTPLMSVTNAISSVIVVGALLSVGVPLAGDASGAWWARILGFFALIMASVNIFGAFLVTQRMLAMYQQKKK
jgi:NAD(P) transhydrogenase subunit alpha